MTNCPECYGTGFVKGWGASCPKGCREPVKVDKQTDLAFAYEQTAGVSVPVNDAAKKFLEGGKSLMDCIERNRKEVTKALSAPYGGKVCRTESEWVARYFNAGIRDIDQPNPVDDFITATRLQQAQADERRIEAKLKALGWSAPNEATFKPSECPGSGTFLIEQGMFRHPISLCTTVTVTMARITLRDASTVYDIALARALGLGLGLGRGPGTGWHVDKVALARVLGLPASCLAITAACEHVSEYLAPRKPNTNSFFDAASPSAISPLTQLTLDYLSSGYPGMPR